MTRKNKNIQAIVIIIILLITILLAGLYVWMVYNNSMKLPDDYILSVIEKPQVQKIYDCNLSVNKLFFNELPDDYTRAYIQDEYEVYWVSREAVLKVANTSRFPILCEWEYDDDVYHDDITVSNETCYGGVTEVRPYAEISCCIEGYCYNAGWEEYRNMCECVEVGT